jgi:Predicted dehydrogenases and related proteins
MKHKMGIIGYGGMATWHHENMARIKNLECTSVYDIDPERLKIANERGLQAFSTLEEFFGKGDFDMVLVATPNNYHKDMAIAAMEKHKHVVCEKPAALSSVEFQEMIAASEQNKVLFTVHHNRRWDRDYRIMSKVVEEGKLGNIYMIEARVYGAGGVIHGWRAHKVAGGGLLLDWGVHILDQIMNMITRKVVNVYALMHSVKTPEVDDYTKVILTFEGGLNAQIEIGTFFLKPLPRWYISGDQGIAYIDDWECNGGIIHAKKLATEWVPEIVQTSAGPTRTMAPRPKEMIEELPLPEVNPDWADFYNNVIDVLDESKELKVKPCEVMRVTKVIEACFRSYETGQSIKVDI